MKMIFFSCTKERLSSHGSSEFSRNAQDVSEDNFSPSSTRKGPVRLFPMIPSKITTLLTPYPRGTLSQLETHPLAQPRPTSDAFDSSAKRMCVFMYFLALSMRKRLCLGVIEGLLVIYWVKAILTRTGLWVWFLLYLAAQILQRFFYLFLEAFYTCASFQSIHI